MIDKIPLGILSCKKYVYRKESIQKTWLGQLDTTKYYPIFLVGDENLDTDYKLDGDILYLKCNDSYTGAVGKIKLYYKWCLKHTTSSHIWSMDDDVYVVCSVFNKYEPIGDYIGNFIYGIEKVNERSGYTSGCAICVSRVAAEYCANELPMTGDYTDTNIGIVLNKKSVIKKHESTIHPWSYCTKISGLMVGHYIDRGEGSMPIFEQSIIKMHKLYNNIFTKTLIAFKTHVTDDVFTKNFQKILNDVVALDNHDFIILNDSTKNNLNIENIKILNYNKQTMIAKRNNYDFWYRADIPLIYAYELFDSYDYYYQIEFDCHMDDWKELFFKLQDDNSDLLSSWMKTPNKEPHWQWWAAHNINMRGRTVMGTYFPVVRLSNKACHTLKQVYEKENIDGFCEIIVPSILNREHMKIRDIADVAGYIKIKHKDEDLLRYKIGQLV